jgi:hypothetical protein
MTWLRDDKQRAIRGELDNLKLSIQNDNGRRILMSIDIDSTRICWLNRARVGQSPNIRKTQERIGTSRSRPGGKATGRKTSRRKDTTARERSCPETHG